MAPSTCARRRSRHMATSSFFSCPDKLSPSDIVQIVPSFRRNERPACKLAFYHLNNHKHSHLLFSGINSFQVPLFQFHTPGDFVLFKVHPDLIRLCKQFWDKRDIGASVRFNVHEGVDGKPYHSAVRCGKE